METKNETRIVLIEHAPSIFDNVREDIKVKFNYLMMKYITDISFEPAISWLGDVYNITIKFGCENGSGYYFDLRAIMKEWVRCTCKEINQKPVDAIDELILSFYSAVENNNKLSDVKFFYYLLPVKFDDETQTLWVKGKMDESLAITKRVNESYLMPWLLHSE